MNELLVGLEQSRTPGAAHKPFELSKILQNTVAVYRQDRRRTAQELRNSAKRLDDIQNGEDLEKFVTDEWLEEYERQLFLSKDESDRQLFLESLRDETDVFLMFANWTERQRQKLYNPTLRNAAAWESIIKEKYLAVNELRDQMTIFHMLKTPPSSGLAPKYLATITDPSRIKARQLVITDAINTSNPMKELLEIKLALQLRSKFIERSLSSIDELKNSIQRGTNEQLPFLEILDALKSKWNIVKIPYEDQVFSTADTNYPYRGEVWIEMIRIPGDKWGLGELEEPSSNKVPDLWAAADEAGFVVDARNYSSTGEGINDSELLIQPEAEWKEKRCQRSFGDPFSMAPPVPIASPFDNPYWCELYVVSKYDEEKMPKEVRDVLFASNGGSNGRRKLAKGNRTATSSIPYQIKSDNGFNGINLVFKLQGDVGACVKEERQLTADFVIQSVKWNNDRESSSYHLLQKSRPVKDFDQPLEVPSFCSFEKPVADLKGNDASGAAWDTTRHKACEELDEFLTIIQRTCIERGIFAVLQGQAVGVLKDLGQFSLVDDESTSAVFSRLSNYPHCDVSVLEQEGGLYMVDKGNQSLDGITRPSFLEVPPTWMCVRVPPIAKTKTQKNGAETSTRAAFVMARKSVSIVGIESDTVSFVCHEVPLFEKRNNEQVGIAGKVDLLVTIRFVSTKKRRKLKSVGSPGTTPTKRHMAQDKPEIIKLDGNFSSPSDHTAELTPWLKWMEKMAVCYLRHAFCETLATTQNFNPLLQFDLHRYSLPSSRSCSGSFLLSHFQTFIFNNLSMSLFK